jgi:hypothetical protein
VYVSGHFAFGLSPASTGRRWGSGSWSRRQRGGLLGPRSFFELLLLGSVRRRRFETLIHKRPPVAYCRVELALLPSTYLAPDDFAALHKPVELPRRQMFLPVIGGRTTSALARPEQRCLGGNVVDVLGEEAVDVRREKLPQAASRC